ncbi:MAG TPA: NAD(P)H-binding protein [Actinophytocola sp.]|uniref:NAD(P)H-binding protein n=1 Tax=Actinophytocola sp. TaxID=1872138 RepID=UPI002E0182C7|nr:NAD(P)H-binding protein [Actinophytocola sp.]
MRVVIAGGHGKIALRLARLLAARGDEPVGIVRNPDHVDDLAAAGAQAVVLDLEHASVDQVAEVLAGADAVVFAAGAGPGSGAARKDTVDHAAAVLVADDAGRAGVRRHVQISAMGLDRAEDPGIDEVFGAYLRAKAAAEEDLRARTNLDWTILRPGRLTDEPATGQVRVAESLPGGSVSREWVAATVVLLLDRSDDVGRTLEIVSAS